MGSIVAVLGFDERHVIKSILRLGFRNIDSVHLIIPKRKEEDRRAVEALQRIRGLAETAGVSKIEEHRVNYTDFDESVLQIADVLASAASGGSEMVLSLGGGMRALVVEAYTAALSLPDGLRRSIKVAMDFETGEGFVEVEPHIPAYRTLSREEALILEEAERGEATPTKISKRLGIPKSTAWKRLSRMADEGLLVKEARGVYRPTKRAMMLLSFTKKGLTGNFRP